MKITKISIVSVLLSASMITVVSCKKDHNNNSGYPMQTQPEIRLQTSQTLGNYLVDKSNRTLYFFGNDPNGQNNCTGGCQPYWPVFNVDNLTADKLGAGLNLSDFGSITAPGGGKQTTYKGWPLYYFAPLVNGSNVPEAAGQTQGDGLFGVWFVAKPDYSVMIVSAQLLGHDGKNYKSDYTEGQGTTTYFTDANGVTLYTFTLDSLNKNKFTAADFSNNALWPIYGSSNIVVPSTLDKTKFGNITVFGRNQLTYQGWPLYYFGQDGMTRGLNKGISFPAPGFWHVPVANLGTAPN